MEVENYKTEPIPLNFRYKGKTYNGQAHPLISSCSEGACFELDVTLNKEFIGTIHCTKNGWTMDKIIDQDFIDAIGETIFLWYE
jgi:hypothetical protein